ncbi:MAG: hypothetical protein OCC49_05735 [Fibrobacterales bacterium]
MIKNIYCTPLGTVLLCIGLSGMITGCQLQNVDGAGGSSIEELDQSSVERMIFAEIGLHTGNVGKSYASHSSPSRSEYASISTTPFSYKGYYREPQWTRRNGYDDMHINHTDSGWERRKDNHSKYILDPDPDYIFGQVSGTLDDSGLHDSVYVSLILAASPGTEMLFTSDISIDKFELNVFMKPVHSFPLVSGGYVGPDGGSFPDTLFHKVVFPVDTNYHSSFGYSSDSMVTKLYTGEHGVIIPEDMCSGVYSVEVQTKTTFTYGDDSIVHPFATNFTVYHTGKADEYCEIDTENSRQLDSATITVTSGEQQSLFSLGSVLHTYNPNDTTDRCTLLDIEEGGCDVGRLLLGTIDGDIVLSSLEYFKDYVDLSTDNLDIVLQEVLRRDAFKSQRARLMNGEPSHMLDDSGYYTSWGDFDTERELSRESISLNGDLERFVYTTRLEESNKININTVGQHFILISESSPSQILWGTVLNIDRTTPNKEKVMFKFYY